MTAKPKMIFFVSTDEDGKTESRQYKTEKGALDYAKKVKGATIRVSVGGAVAVPYQEYKNPQSDKPKASKKQQVRASAAARQSATTATPEPKVEKQKAKQPIRYKVTGSDPIQNGRIKSDSVSGIVFATLAEIGGEATADQVAERMQKAKWSPRGSSLEWTKRPGSYIRGYLAFMANKGWLETLKA